MKLPKSYFHNLTTSKYREYLKLLPDMKKENVRIVTTLIFTFFAMSFFGIFAINPTLTTIVTLKKQLADSEHVYEKLKVKINALSSLQQQYQVLQPDLPTVIEAVPTDPKAALLTGQIIGLSKQSRVNIHSLTLSEVQIIGAKESSAPEKVNDFSYTFSLVAEGSYEQLMVFAKSLSQINRIVNIESLTVAKDPKSNALTMALTGRAYFKK